MPALRLEEGDAGGSLSRVKPLSVPVAWGGAYDDPALMVRVGEAPDRYRVDDSQRQRACNLPGPRGARM